MKRADMQAMKLQLRQEIKTRREVINLFLTTKQKIPDAIVNGKLSDVIQFKEFAEKAGSLYHVAYEPAKRCTVKRLHAINDRLIGIQKALAIDVHARVEVAE